MAEPDRGTSVAGLLLVTSRCGKPRGDEAMGDFSRSMQALGSLPETVALAADPRPAWIWSADGSRILWANGAGGRRLGGHGLGGLCERRYPDSHPLRRELQNAARIAGPDGVLARLRFLDGPRALPMACRVRRLAGPDGEQAILVVGEAPGGEEDSWEAAAEPVAARGQDARCSVSGPRPERPVGNGAAAAGPVRSPIPDWLRGRLATFASALRRDGGPSPAGDQEIGLETAEESPGETALSDAVSERSMCHDRLSPEERAAFEEIAATLAPAAGTSWRGPAQPAANHDAEPSLAPARPPAPPPRNGAPPALPSAFCGATLRPSRADDAAIPDGAMEARLRELASMLDVACDGVVIMDGEGRVESLDGRAEAMFGVRQADVAGHPFADLLAPEGRLEATRRFAEMKTDCVAAPSKGVRELETETRGEEHRPLGITFGRVGGGAADRFCAVLRDLSRWKEAEAKLLSACRRAEEASNHKSDFLARVSHEIRTPLNGIIGFADVIIEERFGPLSNARYREYVRDIRTSGEHVLSLVNDLLDIAKIEAGKLELNIEPVELNQLARECVMLMQPAASRGRIILRTSLAADLPGVRADARTIRQVILNILSNAVKFTGPGGQVIVSTGPGEAGGVVLRVRDTGEGMSEAELARALEPFRQLGTAPLGDGNGTGLGLPLTKALVEANRAQFAISSAKGEGTIVKVGFPAGCLADSSW